MGYSARDYWAATPKEIAVVFDAASDREIRDHNARAWAVWHIAAMQRMKKLPALEKLQGRKRSKEVQTWQQQRNIARMWTSALGGKVH